MKLIINMATLLTFMTVTPATSRAMTMSTFLTIPMVLLRMMINLMTVIVSMAMQ